MSWSENIMAKRFHELDFLGPAVSLLRRTHGSPGENRCDGSRFKSGHGGTHEHCFGIYVEYCLLCQLQRHGCAFKVISSHVDFPRVVRRRDGCFVALLLSSAATRGGLAGSSGGQVKCGVCDRFCCRPAARESRLATIGRRLVRGRWRGDSRNQIVRL